MVFETLTIAHGIAQMSIFLLHIGIGSQIISHAIASISLFI
jgi:hypothetical protein